MLSWFFMSLRRTHGLMLAFGFCMGIIFPFYSSLFFHGGAFQPAYVAGCLIAGLLVGTGCYRLIVIALRTTLDRNIESLRRIAGHSEVAEKGTDRLQTLLNLHDALTEKIDGAVGTLSSGIGKVSPLCVGLFDASRETVTKNEEQEQQVAGALRAAAEMEETTRATLREVQELAERVTGRKELARDLEKAAATTAQSIRSYTSSVMETSASIEELAMSIREISGNVVALSASTEHTADAIGLIDETTGQLRENAARSAALSDSVRTSTGEATSAMAEMLQAIRGIEETSRESGASIERLTAHSSRIDTVLQVITEVVQRTNLLALNASIIAAQAGEHGKSFAVVAEEIRALARRTAESTQEIEELVKGIQGDSAEVRQTVAVAVTRVGEGVEAAARLDRALLMIDQGACEAADMAGLSARGTDEQAEALAGIRAESDRNLNRLRELSRGTQEQEKGISLVVRVLEQMRGIADDLTAAASQQERGNHENLAGAEADAEKVQTLRADALRQLEAAQQLVAFIVKTGEVTEATAEAGRNNLLAVERIAEIGVFLQKELLAFRPDAAVASP